MGQHAHSALTLSGFGVLFPGQGSQYVGMARQLVDEFPKAKQLFEEAADAIRFNLLRLCLEGPEADLQLTENAQPAIVTTSYAWYQVLRREIDFSPAAAAGHSLGEYTALVASEALPFADAVRIVRRRGQLMQEAVPVGVGAMAAVLGLDDEQTEKLCEAASQGPESLVVAANFNAPGQVVLAGHANAVERAAKIGTDESVLGFKARKFIPLKVSAPFHSPLMQPAADGLKEMLTSAGWKKKRFPVAHNVDGKLSLEGDLAELLYQQISSPVRWVQCQQALSAAGLAKFVEPGPGKVLAGLGKRITDGATFSPLDSLEEFKAFAKVGVSA